MSVSSPIGSEAGGHTSSTVTRGQVKPARDGSTSRRGGSCTCRTDQQILTKPVWFEDPAGIEFFDQRNGTPVTFLMPRDRTISERSYELEVLAIEPGWIKVRVSVPRATPDSRDARATRSLTASVHRLNAKGRLQIEYAAAGC